MAEETVMANIEIRDFMEVVGTSDADFVVLSLSDGTSAKLTVGLFRSSVSANIIPSIKDGMWWIGPEGTGVVAEGKTPEFRQGGMGIEWKYTYEADTAWRLLVTIEDIVFTFDELTPEQRDLIKLKFSDLTEEEIAELQQPANDMIAVLKKTNSDIQSAEDTRVKEFTKLKADSEAATSNANDTASHPTYVGEDNYVYKWNKTAQTYDKTSVYVRGEAFSIKRVYASVSDMYADTTTAFKEGDFCLINTNDVDIPENAQLFVRNSIGSWDFLVDMSGAIGFTGKVPQLFIGAVSIGGGKDSAAVTLTPNGTDADGNPKYNINYVIPCLAYEDLTSEQIEDLQRPAKDMIARLQSTEAQVNENEQVRIAAESKRVSAESSRQDNESERKTAETGRATSESNRVKAEAARVVAENARVSAENTRKSNEASRQEEYAGMKQEMQDATKEALDIALEVRNTPIIQNGTWWIWDVDNDTYKDTGTSATGRSPMISNETWWTWDDTAGEYVDSGHPVSSTYKLTKEKIEDVFQGDIETHTHSHLIYYAQVYDVTPDFGSLTSWTGSDGIEHAFVLGNDIYVADADEPTGYANYKLAHSASGNVWVRIPQLPEGYRIVFVPKE